MSVAINDYDYDYDSVSDLAYGKWDQVLSTLAPGKFDEAMKIASSSAPHVADPTGIYPSKSNSGKNFRFFPDYESAGASITNPDIVRHGFQLLMDANKWNFPEALEAVHCLMTGEQPKSQRTNKVRNLSDYQPVNPMTDADRQRKQKESEMKEKKRRYRAVKNLNDAFEQREMNAFYVLAYLQSRGLPIQELPSCLFGHSSMYWQCKIELEGVEQKLDGTTPAMLALITDLHGGALGMHRTYLDQQTFDKFDLPDFSSAKKLMEVPDSISGGAVQLYNPCRARGDNILCVAEGIETAIAVHLATGLPSWSTISAGNLKAVQIPDFITRVIIWADKDASCTGQNVAIELQERLLKENKEAVIRLPRKTLKVGQKSIDWLDMYVSEGPESFLL